MKSNIIKDKSYLFALRIIRLYKYLVKNKEYTISKQILRCGTSIGANVEEAIGGQSSKDFYSKICIAYKEARETHYWLRLLHSTNIINKNELTEDSLELVKILSSIVKTSQEKL